MPETPPFIENPYAASQTTEMLNTDLVVVRRECRCGVQVHPISDFCPGCGAGPTYKSLFSLLTIVLIFSMPFLDGFLQTFLHPEELYGAETFAVILLSFWLIPYVTQWFYLRLRGAEW
jgi:hypothetical protein